MIVQWLLGIANDVVFKDAYPVETPLPEKFDSRNANLGIRPGIYGVAYI